jgi:hypothetical protein
MPEHKILAFLPSIHPWTRYKLTDEEDIITADHQLDFCSPYLSIITSLLPLSTLVAPHILTVLPLNQVHTILACFKLER